ncbi:MAG: glycosyltransferase family 2 protein [Candidatus Marinimicrobia bacterium]|nr:glycosyltransferase family 2 protein [Candidatus Neomarinimicrobiota bacterium]
MTESSTHPLVSVVIPHYGGTDILGDCQTSLNKCSYPNLEIIVVDNASPDDSVQFIKTNFPEANLVQSEFNRGFAGGCNFGVEHANGEYLLILNNDTTHEADWIDHLVKMMESNPKISAVQPKIKNYDNRDYFDYAGACGGFMDKYCFPFARGRIFNTVEKDESQYDEAIQIFWASGTAFLTRKDVFNKIGGFDEIFFAHMEEIDYHWKSQMLGYDIWVEPASVIYHKGAVTLPVSSPKKTYLNYRNSMILLLTNYPISTSMKLFFPRIILECISLIKEIVTFKWSHALAIIKSWIWILGHIGVLKERRDILKSDNIKIPELIFQKSIVLQYFIRKKKKYSLLN